MKTDMKDKRPYERPRLRVVELQQHAQLMQTSAKRTGYGTATEYEWD